MLDTRAGLSVMARSRIEPSSKWESGTNGGESRVDGWVGSPGIKMLLRIM